MEIQGWWDKKVEELSKGMQQKVQFVVTVVHEPKLLIFDEPFSGFDPINVNLLRDEILELRDKGSTIIFSTHNMSSVEELCDNIALINKSVKILDGSVKEIKRNYFMHNYSVHYRDKNNIPFDISQASFEVLEASTEDGLHTATFNLPAGKNPNDLIESLIPYVEIVGFNELIPSMNDIFISTVNHVNTNNIS